MFHCHVSFPGCNSANPCTWPWYWLKLLHWLRFHGEVMDVCQFSSFPAIYILKSQAATNLRQADRGPWFHLRFSMGHLKSFLSSFQLAPLHCLDRSPCSGTRSCSQGPHHNLPWHHSAQAKWSCGSSSTWAPPLSSVSIAIRNPPGIWYRSIFSE